MHEKLEKQFSLDNKVAVVTGAASGIGQGIALLLAEAGAAVVLADLNEAGLKETAAQIEGNQSPAALRVTDISDPNEAEALADFAVDRFGKIDVWVNAAGTLIYKPIVEAQPQDVERIFGVNLTGVYWGVAAAGRRMQAQGSGSIINISSTGADAPSPGLSLYSITKAGVNMLTRTAAAEFGSGGVRVNAIAPGFVDTPMVTYRFRDAEGRIDPAAREALLIQRAQGSPLGVTGTPQDIALAALYLASDASRIVTGQVLRINGGVSMP